MLAEIFIRDDMLETWKHGHIPSHNYFSSLCLRNLVLLYVVQNQFQAQSMSRTTFRQEGKDDEDMTHMHMRRTAKSLVTRPRRPIGASLYSGCSAHKSSNLRSYNAITCSRFSSSSATVEHVSLLMEVAATIW